MEKIAPTLTAEGLRYLQRLSQGDDIDAIVDSLARHPQTLALEQRTSYHFCHPRHLLQALSHRSFIHEQNRGLESNERLEFLGDSLLAILVTQQLFHRHGQLPEGDLSKIRGALVNESTLAQIARSLELEQMILLGKGEFHRKDRKENQAIVADAFESLLAAIYLDSTLDTCLKCINNMLLNFDQDFFSDHHLLDFDAKTRLQELSLQHYQTTPEYRSIESSKDHRPYFR